MRFARVMPALRTDLTCAGSALSAAAAFSAGIRLSSTMVVLPEPETPVTAVRRPFGSFTVRSRTVWMGVVSISIVPFAKSVSFGARSRVRTGSAPVRNPAILEPGVRMMSSMVPCAMTVPPSFPASGPISTM